jgi:hypothetical protein
MPTSITVPGVSLIKKVHLLYLRHRLPLLSLQYLHVVVDSRR